MPGVPWCWVSVLFVCTTIFFNMLKLNISRLNTHSPYHWRSHRSPYLRVTHLASKDSSVWNTSLPSFPIISPHSFHTKQEEVIFTYATPPATHTHTVFTCWNRRGPGPMSPHPRHQHHSMSTSFPLHTASQLVRKLVVDQMSTRPHCKVWTHCIEVSNRIPARMFTYLTQLTLQ